MDAGDGTFWPLIDVYSAKSCAELQQKKKEWMGRWSITWVRFGTAGIKLLVTFSGDAQDVPLDTGIVLA